MGIVNDTIVYECDDCGDRFLEEQEVFIIDGQIDYGGASYGVLGEKEIICPSCFLSKMFRKTGNMDLVVDIVDKFEDEEVEEDSGEYSSADDFLDWGEVAQDALEAEDEPYDIEAEDGWDMDDETEVHEENFNEEME